MHAETTKRQLPPFPPGEWPGYPYQAMPPECPVKVLGARGSRVCVRDASGWVHAFNDVTPAVLQRVFLKDGEYLRWAFPAPVTVGARVQRGPYSGIDFVKLGRCLIAEAGRLPPLSDEEF